MSVYYAQQDREKVLRSNPVYGVFPNDIVISKLCYSWIIKPQFLEDLVFLRGFFGGCAENIRPNIVPAVKKRVRYMI